MLQLGGFTAAEEFGGGAKSFCTGPAPKRQ